MSVFSAKTCRAAVAAGSMILAVPAFADAPRSATPLGNPGTWVTNSDYPAEALRELAEGQSRFRVTVTSDGRVSSCTITGSSGSAALDRKTCELLTLRARFTPATDAAGKPTEGGWSSSIRWLIPKDGAILKVDEVPQPLELVASQIISLEGKFLDCKVERTSGRIAEKVQPGAVPCPARGFSQGYTDANGKPVAKRVRYTTRIELIDVEPGEVAAAERAAAALKEATEAAARVAADAAVSLAKKNPPAPAPTKP